MAHQALDPAFASLLDPDAPCRRIGSGFTFTEGPIWHPRDHFLLFSDIPPSIRRCWDGTAASEFLKPSNKGNGMTYDRELRLLVCEHATSSVARFTDGKREVIASHFEGKELNSPNDIVVARDGSVWFSDPTYGRMPVYGVERPCELDFRGVYRIPPGGGALELVVEKSLFAQPNGLCFSPDEKKLYIADTGRTHGQQHPAHIRVFDLADDGKLGGGKVFADCSAGLFDGFRIDTEGRLWSSSAEGIHCFDPDGTLIGKIMVPEVVSNVCFGGLKRNQLFICGTTSLYSIHLHVNGARTF